MKRFLGLAALVALVAPFSASATDLYNTMGMTGDSSYDTGNGNAIAGYGIFGQTADLQVADDFDVPFGGFKLQELEQASVCFFGQAPADVAIRLYADEGGKPSESAFYEKLAVADLGATLSTSSFSENNFGLVGMIMTVSGVDIDLAEGTYWIDLQPIDESTSADWYYQIADNDALIGAPGHLRDGESGYPGGYGLSDWGSTEVSTYAMRLAGTAIPEPASLGLLVVGAMTALRRRR